MTRLPQRNVYLQSLLLLLWTLYQSGDGYKNCPYGEKCRYEPAPPGQTPPCAQPGLTYCLEVDPYPTDVIRQLVEAGRYDVHTLLSDESRDDFNVRKKQEYPYGYGPNSLPHVDQISIVNQPYDYSYNDKFHTRYDGDIFSHKTALQPPSQLDPAIYNINSYRTTNFSKFPFSPPGRDITQTRTQFRGYEDVYNSDGIGPNFDIDNGYYDQEFKPNYDWSPNRFKQSTDGVSQYNPNEWWNYIGSPSHSDITVQRSITFPTRTTIVRRSARKKRDTELMNAPKEKALSGVEALRYALGLANAANTAERSGRASRQAPGTTELCSARTEFITPKAALNNRGNWRYVVNMPENMTQLVRVEICSTTVCNGICSLPRGYSSRCKQNYIQKRLMALGETGSSLYTDVFWFPSCCQCIIMEDDF